MYGEFPAALLITRSARVAKTTLQMWSVGFLATSFAARRAAWRQLVERPAAVELIKAESYGQIEIDDMVQIGAKASDLHFFGTDGVRLD